MIADPTRILDGLVPPRHDVSGRPQPGEYAAYFSDDIAAVRGDDIVATLEQQAADMIDLFRHVVDADIAGSRYAPGKWTVKEVIGHMVDDERIFSYRALCVARGEAMPLPSFEQDDYQRHARHEERSLRSLLREYVAVRNASLFVFWPLCRDEWLRRGVVAGYSATVRGLAYHIAGHELRHMRALRSAYLPRCPTHGGKLP